MNKIWSVGIVLCLIYALIMHLENEVFNLFFTIGQDSFTMSLKLCLNACFFNGILNIASASGLLYKISHCISPFLRLFFKDVPNTTLGFISVHLIANLFGLGSVATISGLKAMKSLKQLYPKGLSKSMMTLFILNTTGLSFFPTTVISLRQMYQSNELTSFIPIALLISLISLSVGLMIIHWGHYHD